jgi:hypothetical protein
MNQWRILDLDGVQGEENTMGKNGEDIKECRLFALEFARAWEYTGYVNNPADNPRQ